MRPQAGASDYRHLPEAMMPGTLRQFADSIVRTGCAGWNSSALLIVSLLFGGLSCLPAQSAEPLKVRSAPAPFESPGDPVLWDLDHDGRAEILLAGLAGEVAAVDGVTLKRRWIARHGDRGILSLAVGEFEGRPGIVAVNHDGVVRILELWDGSLRASVESGQAVQVPAAVASTGDGNDYIVTGHDDGSVRAFVLRGGKLLEAWSVPNEYRHPTRGSVQAFGRITRPPAVVDLDADGSLEVAIGSANGNVQVIPLNNPQERSIAILPQNTAVVSSAVAANFDGMGKQLVVACNTGLAYSFRYDPTGVSGLGHLIETGSVGVNGEALGPIFAVPAEDPRFRLLIVTTQHQVGVYDGGARFLGLGFPLGTTSPPFSVPAIWNAGGKLRLLVTDSRSQGYVYSPLLDKDPEPKRSAVNLRGTPAVGVISADGGLEAVFVDRQNGRISCVDLGEKPDNGTVGNFAPYGNFARNGLLDGDLVRSVSSLLLRGDAVAVATARQAAELAARGDRGRAEELARVATLLRPELTEVQQLAGPILSAAIRWARIRNALLGLVVIGPVAYWLGRRQIRHFRKRARLRQARENLRDGRPEEALKVLGAEDRPTADESSVFVTYADIYANLDNPPAEALPVLIQAVERNPHNQKLRLALARTYACNEPDTDEALAVYSEVLDGPEGQSQTQLALIAGRVAARRRIAPDRVVRWLLIAMNGPDTNAAGDELALYLGEQGIFSEKYLPVLEGAARRHAMEPAYWSALVRAYHALKRMDDSARRAANRLLELDPNSSDARRLLGHCLYHAGDLHRALEVVSASVHGEKPDPDIIVLYARILGSLRRNDRATVEACRRALDIRGNDAAIELALVRALVITSGTQELSEQDYMRLQRVARANEDDPDLQQGLVQAAKSRGDYGTAIEAMDFLRKQGRGGVELLREMARLIGEASLRDERAENILREAVSALPEDDQILGLLADTISVLQRTDPESQAHIRKALIRGCASQKSLVFLITVLLEQGKPGEALSIIAAAKAHYPTDPEMQRLEAQATLGLDRIEDGIRILEALVSQNPSDDAAVMALADAFARQQVQTPEARRVLVRALEIDGDKALLRLALGRCDSSAGDFASAIPNLKKACADGTLAEVVRDEVTALVTQHPDQLQLRWFLTTLLIEQGRLTEAVSHLEKIWDTDPAQHKLVGSSVDRILALDSNHIGALILRARLQFSVGNMNAARRSLEAAAAKSPGNPQVLGLLVEVLQELVQSGNDPGARIALGRALMSMEKWEAATEVLQVAAQDYRLEAEAGRLLGECYMRQGMLDYALQHLRRQPSDQQLTPLMIELGQLFESAGDVEGAKQAYKHCLVLEPGNQVAKNRLQVLAGITNDPLADHPVAAAKDANPSAEERYEILEELGRGAMGIVYKAHDKELDEIVALKILPDNLSGNSKALARFKTEARSARRLAHPNIVRIHDLGEARGRKFISMEYIDGQDLRDYLRTLTQKLTLQQVHGIIYPIALALDYAHANQIVHRDIKPANIMITRQGVVKVSDFGIAKILQSASETMVGAVIGTPLYMSPEQIQGKPVDHRTDIYSLGIMMYELINGLPPFHEGDLAYQHVHDPPPIIPGIPEDVWLILQRALAKKREDRFQTAGEMARMMEASTALGQAPVA